MIYFVWKFFLLTLALFFATATTAGECDYEKSVCFGVDWKTIAPDAAAKVDVNARDGDEWTPLHFAARHGETPAVIDALLKAGADIEAVDKYERTPLYDAMGENIVNFNALIKAGANVNAAKKSGISPLHLAVFSDSPLFADALLKAGATVDARLKDGGTPLHFAVQSGKRQTRQAVFVSILIKAGANVNARDENGTTPLHMAVSSYNTGEPAIAADNKAVIAALIKAGAEVNARDTVGATPLHHAAALSGNVAVVELLIENNADIFAKDDRGYYTFDYALVILNLKVYYFMLFRALFDFL